MNGKKTRKVDTTPWEPSSSQRYFDWWKAYVGQLCPSLDGEERERLAPSGYDLKTWRALSDTTRRKLKKDGWQWNRSRRLWENQTIEWVSGEDDR